MQTKKSKRILPRSAVLTLLLLVAAGLPPSGWDFSPDSGMELTTTYVPPRA